MEPPDAPLRRRDAVRIASNGGAARIVAGRTVVRRQCEVGLTMCSAAQRGGGLPHRAEREPWGRVFGVLPAAGRSRRMGRPKLLLPAGEGTLIEHVLRTWRACVPVVVVVVHPQDTLLADICRRCGAHVVVAQQPPPDMRASVACALDELRCLYRPSDEDGWLLAPADMPGLTAAAIGSVLAARAPGRQEMLIPVWKGSRGHPVYFPWPLAERVVVLPDGVGIDTLVRQGPAREVTAADASVLSDLDTPEAYEAFLRSLAGD